MIINQEVQIKLYYRFVEFVCRMQKEEFNHEQYKQIIFDQKMITTQAEQKVKKCAEAYLYLINNKNQLMSKELISTSYYLLTNQKLKTEVSEKILKLYYQHKDEPSHLLASRIHLFIRQNVINEKTKFSFMISNWIMLKKNRYPLIPYPQWKKEYQSIISKNEIKELANLMTKMEVTIKKDQLHEIIINKEEIIQTIKMLEETIKKEFHVKKLALYGSQVKETAIAGSDIDFIVEFEQNEIDQKELIYRLEQWLTIKLNSKVDIILYDHALKDLDLYEMEVSYNII